MCMLVFPKTIRGQERNFPEHREPPLVEKTSKWGGGTPREEEEKPDFLQSPWNFVLGRYDQLLLGTTFIFPCIFCFDWKRNVSKITL